MTGAVTAPRVTLAGCRVLVTEDEYMIAQEIADMLAMEGAEALGPLASVAKALDVVAAEAGRIDCALLDMNLRGQPAWPVVDALLAQGVPVLLATGYDAAAIPPAYAGLPRCEKPAGARDLARALVHAMTAHSTQEAGNAPPA